MERSCNKASKDMALLCDVITNWMTVHANIMYTHLHVYTCTYILPLYIHTCIVHCIIHKLIFTPVCVRDPRIQGTLMRVTQRRAVIIRGDKIFVGFIFMAHENLNTMKISAYKMQKFYIHVYKTEQYIIIQCMSWAWLCPLLNAASDSSVRQPHQTDGSCTVFLRPCYMHTVIHYSQVSEAIKQQTA